MMKYCVSGRQPKAVLQMADEIKLEYRDRDILIDFVEDYPDKDYIIAVPGSTDLETMPWESWRVYNEKVNLTLALEDLHMSTACKAHGINFYWAYPATTWSEIRSLIYIGVDQILIGGPLMFQIDKLQKYTLIPLRAIPNLAYNGYMPRENGVNGEYIRPEDLQRYGDAITSVEFISDDLIQEATIMKIYKSGVWNGNLNLIIKNLNYNVDNRGIPKDFAEKRSTCGQRCMMNPDGCHYCASALALCYMIDTKKKDWELGKGLITRS